MHAECKRLVATTHITFLHAQYTHLPPLSQFPSVHAIVHHRNRLKQHLRTIQITYWCSFLLDCTKSVARISQI